MENKDKWVQFKNYLHNELGISNDQIREWVKEAVEYQVEKMIKQEFGKFSLSDYIVKTLKSFITRQQDGGVIREQNAYENIRRDVSDKVAKLIYKDIFINKKDE